MKQFIKDWILPPKVLRKVIEIKSVIDNKYDKSLFNDELRNSERGNRCFIVGTGSSTKQQDLKLLKDEIVIGVSGLYNHDDIDIINPKYYVNPPIFKAHGHYYEDEKFITYLSDMDNKLEDNTIMFFDMTDSQKINSNGLFTTKKIFWKSFYNWNETEVNSINLDSMPSIWSVSESAIQVALYLGFEEIYLLGFDHDWFNGLFNYSFDSKIARKYFKESAEEVSKKHGIDSEYQMRRHAKIFNKYKKLYALKKNIYNANANSNSYVDTFPKVKFESLFEK